MKRQNVKFPWNLYWENKTYKLKRSITVKLQHIYPAKRSAEFQGKISGFPCGKARKKPGKARSDLSLQTFQKFLESPESQGKLFHSFWALMCKKGTELLTRMISSTLGSPLILRFPGKTELKSLETRRENFLKCTLMVSTLSKSRGTLVEAKCCHRCNKITHASHKSFTWCTLYLQCISFLVTSLTAFCKQSTHFFCTSPQQLPSNVRR